MQIQGILMGYGAGKEYRLLFRAVVCVVLVSLSFLTALAQASADLQQPVKAIRLSGVTVAPESEVGKPLEGLLNQQPSAIDLQTAFRALEEWYSARGYVLAKVVSYEQQPDGTLVVEIAEGRIESLELSGNKRTRREVLLREVQSPIGLIYREDQIDAYRRRLGRLPYLKDVKVSPVPADKVGSTRLLIQVEENQALQLALALGYTGRDGLLGYFDVSDNNFLGYGHQVRLQWQRDQYRNPQTNEIQSFLPSYAFSYDAPHLIFGRVNVGIVAYDRSPFYPVFYTVNESLRRFERRQGFAGYVGYDWGESFGVQLQFRTDRVDYDSAPLSFLDGAGKAANRGQVDMVGAQGIWDTRERRSFPRSGSYASLLVESSLGSSQFKFTRYTGDFRHYLPLQSNRTAVFRVRAGGATGSLPLSEQFWIGGFDMLRGYDLDEFHGDRMLLVGAEYRFPVYSEIQGVLFADHGFAWSSGQQVGFGDFKTGVGVGVRFATPIGAIRLDIAYGRKFFTYLSLGQAF
jgi:outer membrane protein insertion porin family